MVSRYAPPDAAGKVWNGRKCHTAPRSIAFDKKRVFWQMLVVGSSAVASSRPFRVAGSVIAVPQQASNEDQLRRSD